MNISYSQTPTNFKTSFKANLPKNNLTQASINTLSKDESGEKQKEKVDYSKIGVAKATCIGLGGFAFVALEPKPAELLSNIKKSKQLSITTPNEMKALDNLAKQIKIRHFAMCSLVGIGLAGLSYLISQIQLRKD